MPKRLLVLPLITVLLSLGCIGGGGSGNGGSGGGGGGGLNGGNDQGGGGDGTGDGSEGPTFHISSIVVTLTLVRDPERAADAWVDGMPMEDNDNTTPKYTVGVTRTRTNGENLADWAGTLTIPLNMDVPMGNDKAADIFLDNKSQFYYQEPGGAPGTPYMRLHASLQGGDIAVTFGSCKDEVIGTPTIVVNN